jgi:thymidylate synthase (FAD)
MRFITDRAVANEMVRHRLFGFAQESTRYVNYSKAQFGSGNIKFTKPAGYDEWSADDRQFFEDGLTEAENRYNGMIARGFTPQQARAMLPSSTKTEIIVTGNDAEWQHFFNLRSKGTTGAPHPDMKVVADMAFALYETA